MSMNRELSINPESPLLQTEGMFYKEFPSDFRQIRYFTLIVIQKAPPEIREINLLEQQISEVLKNAVKHGNRNDPDKSIRIWYYFDAERAHLVVEDEGEGFQEIEAWNDFNRKRHDCFLRRDFEEMGKYVAYTTPESDEYDSGNALFAAVEYWDGGVVFSEERNKVAVLKRFGKKRIDIEMDEER